MMLKIFQVQIFLTRFAFLKPIFRFFIYHDQNQSEQLFLHHCRIKHICENVCV